MDGRVPASRSHVNQLVAVPAPAVDGQVLHPLGRRKAQGPRLLLGNRVVHEVQRGKLLQAQLVKHHRRRAGAVEIRDVRQPQQVGGQENVRIRQTGPEFSAGIGFVGLFPQPRSALVVTRRHPGQQFDRPLGRANEAESVLQAPRLVQALQMLRHPAPRIGVGMRGPEIIVLQVNFDPTGTLALAGRGLFAVGQKPLYQGEEIGVMLRAPAFQPLAILGAVRCVSGHPLAPTGVRHHAEIMGVGQQYAEGAAHHAHLVQGLRSGEGLHPIQDVGQVGVVVFGEGRQLPGNPGRQFLRARDHALDRSLQRRVVLLLDSLPEHRIGVIPFGGPGLGDRIRDRRSFRRFSGSHNARRFARIPSARSNLIPVK